MPNPSGEAGPERGIEAAELGALRAEVARTDEALLELLRRRLELSARIGRTKAEQGIPLVAREVERRVLARAREEASSCDVPPALLEGIFRAILDASLERQQREARALAPVPGRALVVGGAGGMGRWLGALLERRGFDVQRADPAFAGSTRAGEFARLDELPTLEHYDALLLAVPLGATARVLLELAARRPRGVLIEVASIKSPLRASLEQAEAAGVEVLSLHPMFGPSKGLCDAQTFVLALRPGRTAQQQEQRAQEFLGQPNARFVAVPFEVHDELMAWLLGLGHLAGLLFASSLARAGLSAEQLAACASTTYSRQASGARSILAEDPELYLDIQHLNPHRERVYGAVQEALAELHAISRGRDLPAFRALVRRARLALDGEDSAADPDPSPEP